MKKIFYIIFSSIIVIIGCRHHLTKAEKYFYSGTKKIIDNDFRGAILDLNEAIGLDPKIAVVYNNRGGAKYCLKDYVGA